MEFTKKLDLAFKNGIQNAEIAEISKREISQVIEVFTKFLKEKGIPIKSMSRAEYLSSLQLDQEMTRLVSNDGTNIIDLMINDNKLAKIYIPTSGYPCRISWSNNEEFCHDKNAIEKVLIELLNDPWMAGNLKKVVNN